MLAVANARREWLGRVAPMLLLLQHIPCEPPGAYEDELLERGGELVRVEVDEGQGLPDWRGFDGIVAMGGPMGAYEDERLPWLRAEKELIAQAVRSELPFWGVCLGAQLLAASLGGAVAPGPEPEVGVLSVHRTPSAAADPVFSQMPEEVKALQWHSDTFALPTGAVQLARSDAYEQQAFVVNRAYGLQFHIEIGTALAAEWGEVPAYVQSLELTMGTGALSRLLEQLKAHEYEMTILARRLFAAWLEHVVGLQRPGPGSPQRSRNSGLSSR
jgi:GMP synthase-like glutamine amidotransferase